MKAFAPVGLPASAPCASYGLAEHTVACALRITNREGRDLDSLSDEELQACGDTRFAVKFGHVREDAFRENTYLHRFDACLERLASARRRNSAVCVWYTTRLPPYVVVRAGCRPRKKALRPMGSSLSCI